MAVLVAVIRGFARRSANDARQLLAVDLYRSLVYILLPLSIVLAVVLISQGVAADLRRRGDRDDARGRGADDRARPGRLADRDQAARDERRRLLQLELGGARSRTRTALTNFLEMLAILLIPAAQVFMFGRMVGARRQALRRSSRAMFAMFVDRHRGRSLPAEQHGSQVLRALGRRPRRRRRLRAAGTWPTRRSASASPTPPSGRSATTNASNGSVNGGHDALTAGGGAVPIVNMFTGEVIFGGVGSGLYGMFFYIVIAVFVAGLMVGRTPEYLGQEDRGAGDQARRRRRALRPDDGARS